MAFELLTLKVGLLKAGAGLAAQQGLMSAVNKHHLLSYCQVLFTLPWKKRTHAVSMKQQQQMNLLP